MDDYIKRSDAIHDIEQIADAMSVGINRDECNGMRKMKQLSIAAVFQTHAADVRENVRGEWIEKEGDWFGSYWECSNCHHEFQIIEDDMYYRFCQNCGAEMRKEDKHGL